LLPIAAKVKDLKKRIHRAKGDEAEDLKDQLAQLTEGAKIMIDLRGKLWVFFEPPHLDMWNILKPILSHDVVDMEHPFVDNIPGIGIAVKQVVTRGWPACIFCSARNEASWPVWPEIQSRYLITSPNMIPEKYEAGNILISQRMGLPNLLQQSLIVSNNQVELAKKCADYTLKQVQQYDGKNPVWIPFGGILAEMLPAQKGSDNRVTKRIFSFLIIITLTRAHLRGRLQYGDENLVISILSEDFHEVLHITQNHIGIPPYKVKFFKEVFIPLYKSKSSPNQSDDGNRKERTIALTTRELCEFCKKKTGKIINTDNLKHTYLDEFISNGLVDEENSLLDKRQKISRQALEFLKKL
jgi:hypothetical protein